MKRAALPILLALAALGLQGCDQQPSQTHVLSAGPSLPDDTPLHGTAAPAPQVSASAAAPAPAPAVAPAPQVSASAAAPAAPAIAPAPQLSASAAAPQPANAPETATLGGAPDGTAAPTEMSRALQPSRGASAANGPVSADQPAVRDPGDAQGAQLLAQHTLQVPVAGVKPTALSDNFLQARGARRHEAIDILAAAGTPVVAVDDGRIAKLFTSKRGGLTIYQFDPQSRLAYYYAHLQGYAPGVREGMDIKRGDLIGYVGSTGDADAKTPHLHFAVFRLGDPPKWWQGEAVNPYPALSRAQPTDQVAQR